jgi:site-specific DNA recombinase
MEVALYVRVSTSRQQQQQTIEQQLSRLRDYVATQPEWRIADEHIYRDDGYSGGQAQPSWPRPAPRPRCHGGL